MPTAKRHQRLLRVAIGVIVCLAAALVVGRRPNVATPAVARVPTPTGEVGPSRQTPVAPHTDETRPRGADAPRESAQSGARVETVGGYPCILADDTHDWLARLEQLGRGIYDDIERVANQIAMPAESMVDTLERSQDPAHLLTAALLEEGVSTDVSRQHQLLERALDIDPTNPLLAFSLLTLCLERAAHLQCNLPTIERQLATHQPDNAEAWSLVATSCHQREDYECALQAMRRASAAPQHKEFLAEKVSVVDSAFGDIGVGVQLRQGMALGLAMVLTPSRLALLEMCGDRDHYGLEMAAVCLQHGRILETRAQTLLGESIGRGLQPIALEVLGEPDRADALRADHLQRHERG
ncbi:MAG: tetratricopeptide repeat protein, partial [Pseudomonadota bacterium]